MAIKSSITESIGCALRAAECAMEKLAKDVVALDVREICDSADAFVICTSMSPPQTRAISDAVVGGLKEMGRPPWHIEGDRGDSWVLIDCVDVVVHIFTQSARSFYDLDSLWADAKQLELPVS